MTILYDSTRRVKVRPRPFAIGVVLTAARRPEPTEADRRWWAENSPTRDEGYEVVAPGDAHWDRLADEALAQSRVDMGLCC